MPYGIEKKFLILERQILCRHENSPEGLYLTYYPFGELIEVQNMPYKIEKRPMKSGNNYTSPEKPINAIAKIPAVIRAMGAPSRALGTSSNSRRSRIPAKRTKAKPKPSAVETE